MSVERMLLSRWRTMNNVCHGHHAKPTRKQRGGISVCDAWRGKNGFENFKKWALSHGFSPELFLDRIDTKGDYCPENCRYITQKENNRNKINTIFVDYLGEKRVMSELCEEFGVSYSKAYYWTKKGIPFEQII